MKKILSAIIALSIMLISCTVFAATDITDDVLTVEGIGAKQNINAAAGYRAAKIDAMRNALEAAQGVYIDSETTVKDSMMINDTIRTRINGTIRGARIVKMYADGDGYHVVIEVPIHGAQSLAAAVMPATTAAPDPLPTVTSFVSEIPVSTGPYTGLIVDCTGLGLETAMAPGVFTADNQLVYGKANFSYDQVINKGYVGYARSLTNGVGRAGSNPLIVRAQSVQRFVNPVVSAADAAKILSENQRTGFLGMGNVVFVK